jgi:transposase
MAAGDDGAENAGVSEVVSLREENGVLRVEVGELTERNRELTRRNEDLASRIAALEKKLGRNSTNSSLPPSSDLFGRPKKEESPNRAARRALGRKPGKQQGDDGHHLAQVANPDEVTTYSPTACDDCGGDLRDVAAEAVEVRQVFDTPVPVMHSAEHRAETKRCHCGKATKAAFPPAARSYACYGPRLRSNALYLLARQHLPFERCQEAIADLFGINVSTGFLDSVFSEGAKGLEKFLVEVLDQLMDAEVVHVDETSDKLKTETIWFHVACTELLTLLHADETRGPEGIERLGLFPDFTGVAVHDRLGWYFAYDKATHAACGAHLIRNLASVASVDCQAPWATALTALLIEMKHAGERARSAGNKALDREQLATFLSTYDSIVADALATNPAPASGRKRDSLEAEAYNLAVAFRDHKDSITRFATDLRVSFTNNQAERDLRMLKIHHKVSSCFKSSEGASRLAAVRSYISTAMKHGLDSLDVLVRLFNDDVWIPART